MTVIGPSTGFFDPTHSGFGYTDHAGVAVASDKARFTRPLVFIDYERASPGARVRFRTDAPNVTLKLFMNNLAPNNGTNSIAAYIDGVFSSDNAPTRGVAMSYDIALVGTGFRLIELMMPFAAGVDFVGAVIDPRYRILPALPRPPILMTVGDSITHGFESTLTRLSWPTRLSQAVGMQLVNMGFGSSRTIHHMAGDSAAAIQPAKIITALGHNDFGAQVDGNTLKSQYTSMLNTWLTGTSAKIYVVTPFWTNLTGALTIAQYRTAITEAATAIGNSRITVIDGLARATNSTASFPDGIHPNDAGSAEIAASLLPFIAA
ncbi:SGNH/GDSL hydrolase family protein [Tardiphaga sp. 813_E8_N1_3]|uniref:SGNH/GDSL hydrolase family protein n=1 Tax=Tardiphaga sp. 813_E8_N1_3 TaxID=3240760 RepID=UPI003F240CDB